MRSITRTSGAVRTALLRATRARVLGCTPSHFSAMPGVGAGSSSSSSSTAAGATTHFGFRTVDETEKEKMVGEVFRRVADKYDIMNDVMSGTLHRLWKDEFVHMVGPVTSSGDQQAVVLDMAGGTGDISFRLIDKMRASLLKPSKPQHVIVSDINEHMLAVGRARAVEAGYIGSTDPSSPRISFLRGDAEKLPIASNSIDLYTIAFGIRNVTHVDAALREAFRVLKPGGRFMCLEFSHLENPIMQQIYDLYSFNVIPVMGQIVANDRDSYQYLVESIRKFPNQETFANMMRDANFQNVTYTNLTFGVCAVHSGFKWKTPSPALEPVAVSESGSSAGGGAGAGTLA